MKPIEDVNLGAMQNAVKALNAAFELNIKAVGVKKADVLKEFTEEYEKLVDKVSGEEMLAKAQASVEFYNDVYADELGLAPTGDTEEKKDEAEAPKEEKPKKEKVEKPKKEKKAAVPKGKSRYGHNVGSGKQVLDDIFWEGATLKEAADKSGLPISRCSRHLKSILKGYHKLTVIETPVGEGDSKTISYKIKEEKLPESK